MPTIPGNLHPPPPDQVYDLQLAQLIIFAVLFPALAFNLYRHWTDTLAGWFYLVAYAILQIVGGAMNVQKGEGHFSETGLILSQVGTSPILLGVFGVLDSAIAKTSLTKHIAFNSVVRLSYHGIIILSAVLTAVGGANYFTELTSGEKVDDTWLDLAKAGVLVYLLPWLYLAFCIVLALTHLGEMPNRKFTMFAVAVSAGVLLVRIIDSVLSYWDASSSTFFPLTAAISVRVCMQLLPGIITELVMIADGFLTKPESESDEPKAPMRAFTFNSVSQENGYRPNY